MVGWSEGEEPPWSARNFFPYWSLTGPRWSVSTSAQKAAGGRVREEVRKMGAKDGRRSESGDFSRMFSKEARETVREMGGGDDLSGLDEDINKRVREETASMNGKKNYEVGDLSKAIAKSAVLKYTGKDSYAFGDITKSTVGKIVRGSVKKSSTSGTKS